jgi:hypothetical protein
VSRWAIIDQYARTGIPFLALRSIFIAHDREIGLRRRPW